MLVVKHDGKVIGKINADGYLMIEEALRLLGAVRQYSDDGDCPDYMIGDTEIWYDNVDLEWEN